MRPRGARSSPQDDQNSEDDITLVEGEADTADIEVIDLTADDDEPTRVETLEREYDLLLKEFQKLKNTTTSPQPGTASQEASGSTALPAANAQPPGPDFKHR